MDGIERLKGAMVRVEALVDFYKESPTVTLDMMDSFTEVTMEDLETLLDGLADRDISLKRPKCKTPREIEKDAKLVKQLQTLIPLFVEREIWAREYEKGYKAGRDGEVKRIRELIERCITDG
ncbi:hypothetical protein LCGC14_2422790 [marine sediment metagenome]|uniref:Uncharacterized protein n=1 Tax=marine sediment metagenome TaxID=412755 RepID=A0A0F9BPA2_9ZZZZ